MGPICDISSGRISSISRDVLISGLLLLSTSHHVDFLNLVKLFLEEFNLLLLSFNYLLFFLKLERRETEEIE